jgi:short-subunit dehydrogenase
MAGVDGRRVLLTGASSGIGERAARILAAKGARLALVARRRDRLQRLGDELEGKGFPRPAVIGADLGEPGVAAAVAAKANEALGGIDVLVNNAGASVQGLSWVAGDRADARRVFETNFWSPLALVSALAPAMIQRRQGAIVNTGSMAQVSPFPHLGHYSASRAALASMTATMRLELEPRGIRVVEVAFGPVDTAGSTENRLLAGGQAWLEGRPGIGKLEDAALTLAKAVEGPASGVLFYPRALRWAHRLPGLGRRYARRSAMRADLADTAMRVGGSAGDDAVREARDAWERAQR